MIFEEVYDNRYCSHVFNKIIKYGNMMNKIGCGLKSQEIMYINVRPNF